MCLTSEISFFSNYLIKTNLQQQVYKNYNIDMCTKLLFFLLQKYQLPYIDAPQISLPICKFNVKVLFVNVRIKNICNSYRREIYSFSFILVNIKRFSIRVSQFI